MRFRYGSRERKRVVWGVILISVGVILLLNQMGLWGYFPDVTWWPAILFVIGAAQIFSADRPKAVASGLSFMLVGVWFFAVIHHWHGLTYRNGWPLLLVIFGGEMVLAGLLERLVPNEPEMKKEEGHV